MKYSEENIRYHNLIIKADILIVIGAMVFLIPPVSMFGMGLMITGISMVITPSVMILPNFMRELWQGDKS